MDENFFTTMSHNYETFSDAKLSMTTEFSTEASRITYKRRGNVGYEAVYHDVVFSTVSFLALILNIAALVVIFRKQKKHPFNPSEILLVCQMIFDGSAGLSNMLWMIITNFAKPIQFIGPHQEILCRVIFSNMFTQVVITTAIFNIVLLNLERYMMIIFPVRHRNSVTRKKTFIAVGINVAFSTVFIAFTNIYPTGVINGRCIYGVRFGSATEAMAFFAINFSLRLLLPIITFLFCYTHMFISLYKRRKLKDSHKTNTAMTVGHNKVSPEIQDSTIQAKPIPPEAVTLATVESTLNDSPKTKMTHLRPAIAPHSNSTNVAMSSRTGPPNQPAKSSAKVSNLSKVELNILVIVIVLNVVFLACNMPIRLQMMIWSIYGFPDNWASIKFHTMSVLATCYLFLHPIVYVFAVKKFRDDVKKLLFCCK